MSSQFEPAIWSRDTGQQIPCFDRCQLTITWMLTWMSNKSNVRYQRCPEMSNWTMSFDVRLMVSLSMVAMLDYYYY